MPKQSQIEQSFTFRAADALSVQLVGDFTHWQKNPIQMQKGSDGFWHATVQLAPGTYHYRFLVDGQWRDDPECTVRVRNPYGSENVVREVRESAPGPVPAGAAAPKRRAPRAPKTMAGDAPRRPPAGMQRTGEISGNGGNRGR